MVQDQDVAAEMAAHADGRSQSGPRVSDWTPEVALLADIHDRLGTLIAAVAVGAGVKKPTFSPSPRPRTAIDRHRESVSTARHLSLVAEVKAAQGRTLD